MLVRLASRVRLSFDFLSFPAKKPAWGSVQSANAVSIKDQEAEAAAKTAKGKGHSTQSKVVSAASGETVPKAPVQPVSSGPAYTSARGEDHTEDRGRSYEGRSDVAGGRSRWGDRDSGYNQRSFDRSPPRRDRDDGERGNDRYGGDRPKYNPDVPSHGGHSSRSGDSRPPRSEKPHHEVPFPTEAPYILYLNGLPYEGTEAEVRELLPEFLGDLASRMKNVKVPIRDGRLKHAFLEFDDADALREALELSSSSFMGRTVQCLVAEPPRREERGGFGGSRHRDGGDRGFGSSFGSGFQRGDRDGPRRPVVAPRGPMPASEPSESGASSKPKSDPFGGATASVRDIYADKPKETAARAPAATSTASSSTGARGPSSAGARSSERPASSGNGDREESRADTRDWKTKGDFKPASGFRAAPAQNNSANRGGDRRGDRPHQGGGRNNNNSHNRSDDGDSWKSAGGKPSQPRKAAAPAAAATSGSSAAPASSDKSNMFNALGDE